MDEASNAYALEVSRTRFSNLNGLTSSLGGIFEEEREFARLRKKSQGPA
jgi:hypothetical protein